jgi:Tfp pilus assembly protein PilZ
MSEDRRTARRAHVPGVQATYETANGERRQAEVLDLGPGGLFLATDVLPAVGKRLSLEIIVTGEPAPWSALGRVIWTRSAREGTQPAGMAVKLIDVEDAVVAAIERLVAMRERTEPGVGDAATATAQPQAPAPERTVLGIGGLPEQELPTRPIAFEPIDRVADPGVVTPRAERPADRTDSPPATAVGAIAREPSIAIDLVSKKSTPPVASPPAKPPSVESRSDLQVAAPASPARVPAPPEPAEEGEAPTKLAKRGRSGVWLLLLAVIALAGAAYAFREKLLALWNGVS